MVDARTEEQTTRRAEPGNIRHCLGNVVNVLVTGEDTHGTFAVIETRERRGSEPPLHRHNREDEFVYVLDGRISYYTAGKWLSCPAGTCMFLPRGSEHTYAVESECARLLTILVPAGLEGYYREMDGGDAASQAGAPDFERFVTVAAGYGVEITGPAQSTRTGLEGAAERTT